MPQPKKIVITDPQTGQEILSESFMTAAEYEAFGERFSAAVKPELDRQAEARRKSIEAAMWHFIG